MQMSVMSFTVTEPGADGRHTNQNCIPTTQTLITYNIPTLLIPGYLLKRYINPNNKHNFLCS